MATYFMFGKYSWQALEGISSERTKKAQKIIQELGGKVNAIYSILGEYDVVLIVELPGIEQIMKASISLNMITGISFNSMEVIPVEEFDRIME